jgi:hypothetical protein
VIWTIQLKRVGWACPSRCWVLGGGISAGNDLLIRGRNCPGVTFQLGLGWVYFRLAVGKGTP